MDRNSDAEVRTILIVDDEADLVQLLKYNLEQEGFETRTAYSGNEGLKAAREHEPDLIILDVMMPGLDGLQVCRILRQDAQLKDIPILMLTARTADEDQVEGLDVGADIYVGKPVSVPVLVSQVKALFRRTAREGPAEKLQLGDLEIDRGRYLVIRNGREIRLPRKEFELLYFLASNRGRVHRRQELLDEVWGPDVYVVDRTVDVHVRKIREKLGSELIETVTGVGYTVRE